MNVNGLGTGDREIGRRFTIELHKVMKISGIQLGGRVFRLIAKVRQSSPIRLAPVNKRSLVHPLFGKFSLRVAFLCLTVGIASLAGAETKIVEGTIAQINEKSMILTVGTQPLAVEEGFETRFWSGKSEAKRDIFKVGDRIFARIKTDADPPQLRELADKTTWDWLDHIRKEPQEGTVEKVDDKFVILKLSDGSTFKYRATAKTQVQLKDKPTASTTDLAVGQHVWAKGRTLPTLDTWLVTVTDTPMAAPIRKTPGHKREKSKPLAASGKLTGTIIALLKPMKMFDVIVELKTLHITYDIDTKFYLDGKAAFADDMRRNMEFSLTYRRDKFGRILASKVELFSRPRT